MNRGHTLEEYDYIIRTLQEQEKIGDTILMSGFPTETQEDLEKTINYIKERKIYVEEIADYTDFYEIPSHELD
jgi:tRNA A37 methylthiotransferase MiaB